MNRKSSQMNFEIPPDLRTALYEGARAVDSSASKFVRDAVREKLDRIRRERKTETPVLNFGRSEKVAA